jgi:uncharacterized protein (DUF362 family)
MDNEGKSVVYVCHSEGERGDWRRGVFSLLDATRAAGLCERLSGAGRVLIKPNLVEAIRPPVTTPVGLISAIVDYIRERSPETELIVGDGTGAAGYDTPRAFEELGYTEMAEKKSIDLVDLNTEPLVKLSNPGLSRWPEMYLPRIVMESFLLSVPVLKAHSLSCVTLTMKNVMGCAPPLHYQAGGHWKKSAFHEMMQASILDLNRYRTPDFTILDATVGMAEAHLCGPACDPPPGLLVAGSDPVAVDAYGAGLLKKDWRTIEHISRSHGKLGRAEPLEIVEVGL